jgi:signal transduction histidine kinase
MQWAAAFSNADAYLRSAWEQFARSYEWIEFRDRRGFVLYRLSPPFVGTDAGGAGGALTVVKPIVDPRSGQVLGTLVAVVRRDALIPSAVLEIRFGRAGYTMVLDRLAGLVVYHPSHALVRQPIAALLGAGGWGVDTALLGRERGSFGYRERGTARVAAFVSLGTPPWTVLSSGAVDEFAGPFVRTRLVNLALVLLVTATTALAFVSLTRRATRSLEALTAAADQVGGGNFAPALPAGGRDEVGRLAAAFGIMVGKVRNMLREIEANRHMAAVGEFAARLSHEIRNPLTSIKLNLQRLERAARTGALPGESRVPLEICLREIERLDRVVRGALSLGRDQPAHRVPCALHEIVGDALGVVRAQLDQQGVSVATGFGASTDRVMGEPEHLKAVFLNLFLNAAEAMPDGGRLRVTTECDGSPRVGQARIRVRVADTGGGIPPEQQERIFQPFFSTKPHGTGFGLPLALRTVEEHGGRIGLAADGGSGGGAVFEVELPLASPEPQS